MKSMIKDAVILFVITLVAGLALGYVNSITKEPIAIAKQNAKEAAYKEVFSDASSFEDAGSNKSIDMSDEGFEGVTIDEVMLAKDTSSSTLGYVITVTTNQGYGGDITFSVGIRNDGTINGISILSISETAGLGMKAEEVLKPQYANKNVGSFTVTKMGATTDEEIDAISGATITSNAVTGAVNASLSYFENTLGGGADEE